jgi:hypothetical protein
MECGDNPRQVLLLRMTALKRLHVWPDQLAGYLMSETDISSPSEMRSGFCRLMRSIVGKMLSGCACMPDAAPASSFRRRRSKFCVCSCKTEPKLFSIGNANRGSARWRPTRTRPLLHSAHAVSDVQPSRYVRGGVANRTQSALVWSTGRAHRSARA